MTRRVISTLLIIALITSLSMSIVFAATGKYTVSIIVSDSSNPQKSMSGTIFTLKGHGYDSKLLLPPTGGAETFLDVPTGEYTVNATA